MSGKVDYKAVLLVADVLAALLAGDILPCLKAGASQATGANCPAVNA